MIRKKVFMVSALCMGLCGVSQISAVRIDAQELRTLFYQHVVSPVQDFIQQEQNRLRALCAEEVLVTCHMVELEWLMISFGISETHDQLGNIESFFLRAGGVEINGLEPMRQRLELQVEEATRVLRTASGSTASARETQERFLSTLESVRNQAIMRIARASNRIEESIQGHMHELRDEMQNALIMHEDEFEARIATHTRAIMGDITSVTNDVSRVFGLFRSRLLRALR